MALRACCGAAPSTTRGVAPGVRSAATTTRASATTTSVSGCARRLATDRLFPSDLSAPGRCEGVRSCVLDANAAGRRAEQPAQHRAVHVGQRGHDQECVDHVHEQLVRRAAAGHHVADGHVGQGDVVGAQVTGGVFWRVRYALDLDTTFDLYPTVRATPRCQPQVRCTAARRRCW